MRTERVPQHVDAVVIDLRPLRRAPHERLHDLLREWPAIVLAQDPNPAKVTILL
ncbi:MAG TPA: hypothetical protein VLV86_07595 [Vicinamibacterales bacterium]|nr:hypothetical protein [Vicinamibacterales bacterium]